MGGEAYGEMKKTALCDGFVLPYFPNAYETAVGFFNVRRRIFMKRATVFLISLFLSFCFSFASCNKEAKPVIITADSSVAEGTTLLVYMEELQESGKLTFTVQNGMVTSLNGTKNGTNSYWMLYTSDENNANTAWGSFDYEGETLGSATLGVADILIVAGETYAWVYQSF